MSVLDTLKHRLTQLQGELAKSERIIADAESQRAIRVAAIEELAYAIQLLEEEGPRAPAHVEPVRARRNLRKLVIEAIGAPGCVGLTEHGIRIGVGMNQRDLERIITYWKDKGEIHEFGGLWRLGAAPLEKMDPPSKREKKDIKSLLEKGPLPYGDLRLSGITEVELRQAVSAGLVEEDEVGYRLRLQPDSEAA